MITLKKNYYGLLILLLVTGVSCQQKEKQQFPMRVAKGEYPDMVVDGAGDLHLVYGRNDTLFYKKFDRNMQEWTGEVNPGGMLIRSGDFGIRRSDPDIVVDSENQPHIFAGSDYVYRTDDTWQSVRPLQRAIRDTELAIDHNDNLYLLHRGGNNVGDIGILRRKPGSDEWVPLADPDNGRLGMSNHVYPDMDVDSNNNLYVIQRHAYPSKGTQVNISYDGGKTWENEKFTIEEPESPHIVIDSRDSVFATHGGGELFKRTDDSTWVSEGYPIHAEEREQPELAVDQQDNVYVCSWGGKYNVRVDGKWGDSRRIHSVTGKPVGFVEPYGSKGFAFAVWEEGQSVDPDKGAGIADIVVGKIKPGDTTTEKD